MNEVNAIQPLLTGWDGEVSTEIEISNERIAFNGINEGSHETFSIYKKGQDFQCCKTARKGYDLAVVAMLCAIDHIAGEDVTITSDGRAENWLKGKELAENILGEILDIPHGVENPNFG